MFNFSTVPDFIFLFMPSLNVVNKCSFLHVNSLKCLIYCNETTAKSGFVSNVISVDFVINKCI
jgi:hypothetical protein